MAVEGLTASYIRVVSSFIIVDERVGNAVIEYSEFTPA